MSRRALTLVVCLATLALLAGAAHPAAAAPPVRTLTVDDNGKDCPQAKYTSLQQAVNVANDGDTVVVCAGTYLVGDEDHGLVIQHDVTVRGAGADRVTIVPRGGPSFVPDGATLRDGTGVIVLVKGSQLHPTTAEHLGRHRRRERCLRARRRRLPRRAGFVQPLARDGARGRRERERLHRPRRLPLQPLRRRHRGHHARAAAGAREGLPAADDHDRPHAGRRLQRRRRPRRRGDRRLHSRATTRRRRSSAPAFRSARSSRAIRSPAGTPARSTTTSAPAARSTPTSGA